jgi:hypothetical protein
MSLSISAGILDGIAGVVVGIRNVVTVRRLPITGKGSGVHP